MHLDSLKDSGNFPSNVRVIDGTIKEIGMRTFFGTSGTLENIVKYAYLIIESERDIFKVENVFVGEAVDSEVVVGNRCKFFFASRWNWSNNINYLVATQSRARGTNMFSPVSGSVSAYFAFMGLAGIVSTFVVSFIFISLASLWFASSYSFSLCVKLALVPTALNGIAVFCFVSPRRVRNAALAVHKKLKADAERGEAMFDARELKIF